MSAIIIPFPTVQPRTRRDRVTAEYVRLIREACKMEVEGRTDPDWKAYVDACLEKADSD